MRQDAVGCPRRPSALRLLLSTNHVFVHSASQWIFVASQLCLFSPAAYRREALIGGPLYNKSLGLFFLLQISF
jgi:hypothetical protein